MPLSRCWRLQATLRAAIVLSVICAPGTACAQWSIDAQGTRLHDSNVPRAQLASDVMGDSVTRVSVAASRELYAGADSSIAFTGEAAVAAYDRFHSLSNTSLGALLTARRKLGLGLTAPWLELSASAARESYSSTIRTGSSYAAAFTGGRRFSELFDVQLGARYDRRRADNDVPDVPGISGRAFDLQGRSLFAQLTLAISQSLLVNIGLNVRHGDVVSTASETPFIIAAANAICLDPAFGDEGYAYRLSGGITRTASAGLSWALGAHSSLEGRVEKQQTSAHDGFGYRGTVLAIYYLYSR